MQNNFKLTLAAGLVGLAFSAQAADVSVYGSVSTGLALTHTRSLKAEGVTEQKRSSTLAMESGFFGDSIWGITAEEELADGWKVGVTLENEFLSDSGEAATEGKIFDSQSYIRIGNDFVTVAAGNFGGLSSAGGDFDLLCGYDPMDGFFGIGGLGTFASKDYASDNMAVVEMTPVEGLKVSLMGSFGESDSASAWHDRTHYYGLGAQYEAGNLSVAGIAETIKYEQDLNEEVRSSREAYFYTVAASYDLGVIKPAFAWQHSQGVRLFDDDDDFAGAYKLNSFMLGATAPAAGGTVRASLQYLKGKNEDDAAEKGKAWVLALGYTYELSKRTTVWSGLTWAKGDDGLDANLGSRREFGGADRAVVNATTVGLGLSHTF